MSENRRSVSTMGLHFDCDEMGDMVTVTVRVSDCRKYRKVVWSVIDEGLRLIHWSGCMSLGAPPTDQ